MSKLTAYISASDSLIQPSGATAGQTLTWNDSTGQFEPTSPTGGDTPEMPIWQANTTYAVGDLAYAQIIGAVFVSLRRAVAGVSQATLTASEISDWDYLGQVTIPVFPEDTVVSLGFLIRENNIIWQSLGNRVTGTVFDSPEQSNWTALTTPPSLLPNFTTNLVLRGDGTNVPVTDTRLNFATANAVDIGGTSGLRVSSATAGQIDLNLLGSATAAGNALKITSQSAVGSNNNGGNIEFTSGATTGSGFSSIRFNTPLSFGTAGATTVNAPALTWQMFTNSQNTVLEGVGNNNALTARLDKNLKIATSGLGNLQVQAEATGSLALGVAGTGSITIGSAGKTTTISGLVKQPGKSVFKAQRATSTQAISANLQTTVIFNASSVLGTNASPVTLDAATGIMTFTRTGTYRVSGCISVQSATANARVGLAFVPGTAVCSSTNIENNLLNQANVPRGLRFEYIFTCTTVGTFSIQIGSTAALTVGFNQGTIFAPTKTNCIIDEIA